MVLHSPVRPVVVIADLDTGFLDNLNRSLHAGGYSVVQVHNAGQLLWELRQHPSAVLLGDLNVLDIKADFTSIPIYENIPAMIFSQTTLHSQVMQVFTPGAVEYHPHPVNIPFVIQRLQWLQSLRRMHQPVPGDDRHYRTLLDNINEVVCTVDHKGCYTFASGALERLSQFRPDDLLGNSVFDYIPLVEKGQMIQDLQACTDGSAVRNDYHMQRKDGVYQHVRISNVPLQEDDQDSIIQVITDISDYKLIEAGLRDSEGKFRAITESMAAAVFIIHGERFLYANPVFEQMSGYSWQELQTMKFWEFLDPSYADIVRQRATARQRGEVVPPRYELLARSRYGERFWWDFTATYINYDNKQAILGVAIDITQRKRAEQALRDSEAALQNLLDNMLDAVFIHDEYGRLSFANQTLHRMYAVDHVDALNYSVADYSTADNPLDTIQATWQRVLQGETFLFEWNARRPRDGSTFPVEVYLCPVTIHGRKKVMAMVRDITQRRKNQEALRLSEEQFRSIFEEGPLGMVITDAQVNFVKVNAAFCRMTGYAEEELMSLHYQDITHPDDIHLDIEGMNQLIAGAVSAYQAEKRYLRKDGGLQWVALTVSAVHDSDGKFMYFLAMAMDINQRKRALQALQESEERFRRIFDDGPLGMLLVDPEYRIVQANEAFYKMGGYTDLLSHSVEDITHPEDYPATVYNLPRLKSGEIPIFHLEKRYIRPDGGILWGDLTVSAVRDEKGCFLYYLGMVMNITQRRQAQEALRKSKETLELLLNNLQDAVMIYNMDGSIGFVNSQMLNMYGVTQQEALQSTIEARSAEENALEVYRDNFRRVMAGEKLLFQWKARRPNNGFVFPVEVFLQRIKIDDQYQVVAIVRDISNRLKAEEAIRKSGETLALLLNNLLDAILIYNPDGSLSFVNDKMLAMYQLTREEALKTSVEDRSAEENSMELFQEIFARVLVGESPLFEWRAKRPKDGHVFPVEIFYQRILIDGEYRAMAMVRDITARKQAEEAVQVMMQNIVDGIIIHDLDGRIVYVNQVMLDMYGVTQEEALQYDVFTYSARDIPRYIIQRTWSKVLDGTVLNDEWECQRPKDGKLFPVELYLRRIYLNGKMLVMTMLRDISIRKQAESLLKEAHQQLAESYHRLQQANDELEDKVVSRTQELQSMNQELQAINIELLDLNNSLAREIDERRRMEGELADANQELSKALENLRSTQSQLVQAEKMASLGTLVAGVAHEINSPVGVGVTAASHLEKITHEFLRLYEKGSLNKPDVEAYLEDCREAVKIVLSNLEWASRLIRSFKQVSADQSSENRRRFDVCHYLQEIVISMQPQLKKARVSASVSCREGIIVDSYPGAFAQILTNLIMNSLMHAYGVEDTGRISIEVQPSDSGILLIYRDDGRGMDQETRERIYDPFFTTRRGSGGTGLGMYIIYNLVYQQFHGTIDCQSIPGKGSAFIIRLDMGGTSA